MNQSVACILFMSCVLSACQKKAEGQTVAIVNGQEITAADLNAELGASVNTAADPKAVRAAVLQKLVGQKLLVEEAQSDGIDKTPEYLNQQRRLNDELLINMLISRRLKTSQVPTPDEINRFEASNPQMFANRESWNLDQIAYAKPKDAAILAKIAATKSLNDVIQILNATGIHYQRRTKKIDTAALPNSIYNQLAHLPAGEPFIASGGDQSVASVIISREPNPITGDNARQVALNGIKRDQAQQFVANRIKALRASAKIEYQPGFEPPKK